MGNFEASFDIEVYVEGAKEPILASGLFLAAHSKLFAELLSSMNFCDGCPEKKCIIITGEDKDIVKHTLNYVYRNSDEESSDIQIEKEMLALAKRLQIDSFVFKKLDKTISKSATLEDDNVTVDEVAKLMSLKTALLQIASDNATETVMKEQETTQEHTIGKEETKETTETGTDLKSIYLYLY
jgi:hypothetical protein